MAGGEDSGQKSLLDEIHSISPYLPYQPKNDAEASYAAGTSDSRTSENSDWRQRRAELMERANDNVVVNLQDQHITPFPRVDGRGFAEGGSIKMSSALSGDSLRHANDAQGSVIVPWNDAQLKADIIRILSQWLADEGFGATRQTLLEEAGIKLREQTDSDSEHRKLKSYLLEGNWSEVDKLCSKTALKNEKAFLYAVYKQQFLEHIDHREYQKAFTFLHKRLKPLEHYQAHAAEFGDLCYLLSAKSVTDAPSFQHWEGIQPARETLVNEFAPLLDQNRSEREGTLPGSGLPNATQHAGGNENELMGLSSAESSKIAESQDAPSDASAKQAAFVPPHRLLCLLHQAVAYQVEYARYQSRKVPVVSSLLQDYTGFVIPNRCRTVLRGHAQSVKCVTFVGSDGKKVASGSSDCTVRLWNTETGVCEMVYDGHRSRIWDLDSSQNGDFVASASGDSTVKIWSTEGRNAHATLEGAVGDVYCCSFSPDQGHLVSGGYDKLVRLWDLGTGKAVRMFPGHQLGVSATAFSPLGNVIATGAKDTTIRFWDSLSGLCIRTLPGHLGEVTSVRMSDDGMQLLTSSKDNSNRLWDMRMLRPLQRFKGSQNTSKNFIRSTFAHPSLVASGSEDGLVYLWDSESSRVLQTLEGHGMDSNAPHAAQSACMTPAISISASPRPRPGLPRSHSTIADEMHPLPTGSFVRGNSIDSLASHRPPRAAYNTRMQVVVYDAAWSKTQGLLASCADDCTVRLWDWVPQLRRVDE